MQHSSLKLYSSERFFFVSIIAMTLQIRSIEFISRGTRTLVIERTKNRVFEDAREEGSAKGLSSLMSKAQGLKEEGGILGVLGVVNIVGNDHLAVISQAELIGVLGKSRVFKVTKIELIPFQ